MRFTSFDLLFACIVILIGWGVWYYLRKRGRISEKKAKYRILFSVFVVLVVVAGVIVHQVFLPPTSVFPEGVKGILVLQIEGDYLLNTLQDVLVSELTKKVRMETPGQRFEIQPYQAIIDRETGLPEVHEQAREIGRRVHAHLVIWGSETGRFKFQPRVTVVNTSYRLERSERATPVVQVVDQIDLPEEVVTVPVYLTHFIAGYLFYESGIYSRALPHFEALLDIPTENPETLNDVRLYAGVTHLYLGRNSDKKEAHFSQARSLFEAIVDPELEQKAPEKWAAAQNNLGVLYSDLPPDDRSENFEKAVSACEAALRVYTEENFPMRWATTQNNLGVAYRGLSTDKKEENLQKAIAAYEAALRVRTENMFPVDWAVTQKNLAVAYSVLPTGDRGLNLQRAVVAYQAALRIFSEADFPIQWAKIQIEMGNLYAAVGAAGRSEHLEEAAVCFENALRVFTSESFPGYFKAVNQKLESVQKTLQDPEHH